MFESVRESDLVRTPEEVVQFWASFSPIATRWMKEELARLRGMEDEENAKDEPAPLTEEERKARNKSRPRRSYGGFRLQSTSWNSRFRSESTLRDRHLLAAARKQMRLLKKVLALDAAIAKDIKNGNTLPYRVRRGCGQVAWNWDEPTDVEIKHKRFIDLLHASDELKKSPHRWGGFVSAYEDERYLAFNTRRAVAQDAE